MSGEPEKPGEEAAKQDPAAPDAQGAEEPQEIRQDERPAETGIPDEAGARTGAPDGAQADVQDGAQDGVQADVPGWRAGWRKARRAAGDP